MPHIIQIAYLDFGLTIGSAACLLPGTVIWIGFYEDKTIFRVWDYRLNHSISFSVESFERVKVYFVLSKALKSASNSLVCSHWRRRPLSSSHVTKQYLSGPFHLYRINHPIFSTTIPPIYHLSSQFHFRMALNSILNVFDGIGSIPGIFDLHNLFISTRYVKILNFIGSKSCSNLTSVLPHSMSLPLNSLLTISMM